MAEKEKPIYFELSLRVVDKILNASKKEFLLVFLVGLLVLLTFFIILLNQIDYLDQHSREKFIAICVFVVLYILAGIFLFWGSRCEEKYSKAKDRIERWLKEKVTRSSFDALRKNFDDPSLTDAFLKKLLKKYPKVFRSVEIKGGLPGITLTRNEFQVE